MVKIIEISVCSKCNKKIQEGCIDCPGCHTKDPKIRFEHLLLKDVRE